MSDSHSRTPRLWGPLSQIRFNVIFHPVLLLPLPSEVSIAKIHLAAQPPPQHLPHQLAPLQTFVVKHT